MGLAKNIYTRRSSGEKINYNPKPKEPIMTGTWNVIQIPEGVLDINEIEKPKQKKKKVNVAKQIKIIKKLDKAIKKQESKTLFKTASINDVQKALGKKYLIERDTNYKCRRWIVTKDHKEWRIRFNDPLMFALSYIEQNGAAKFLKDFSMKSKYN